MKNRIVPVLGSLGAAILIFSGCSAKSQPPPYRSQASPDRIAPAELLDVPANNAYEAVEQLRPQWLRLRGPTSLIEPLGERPAVYLDNVRYGDLEVLRDIPINEIQEIVFINGPDATNRWGTGVVAGVIEVIRKSKSEE